MDKWKLQQINFNPKELGKYESLFTVGNGNLGLRGNLEEIDSNCERGTYINGFYEIFPIKYGESAYGYAKANQTIVNLADGKIFRILVDGELFTTEKASGHTRELDIKQGVLTRDLTWMTKSGAIIKIKIQRLVSLIHDSTALQILEINVTGKKVKLEIVSILSDAPIKRLEEKINDVEDPRVGSFSKETALVKKNSSVKQSRAYMIHQTQRSGMSVFSGMDHSFSGDYVPVVENLNNQAGASVKYKFEDVTGSVKLTKYLCYQFGYKVDDNELKSRGLKSLDLCLSRGHEYYLKSQESYLSDFWKRTDIMIRGDLELQFALRFNMFHLLQSTGKSGKVSIAAKGLTGLGYEGHYFWDTEIYVLPWYIYTNPVIAKSLLTYRHSILGRARLRAEELSHKGVLFPWRTINGDEASAYFPAGTAQYHINADIAFGISKYVKSTGDIDLLMDYGLEILVETARFWYGLGSYIPGFDGAFCIHEVTGPDEYTALVNNNLYTNIMARENIITTCTWLRTFKESNYDFYETFTKNFGISLEEISAWEKAAEKMRIPYDSQLGLFAQDDAFLTRPVWDFKETPSDKYPLLLHFHPLTIYRYQVIKQADLVMALFLMGKYFSYTEKKRNFDYYEKLTTGDSSLSSCIQGIVAAELGYLDLAEKYMKQTAFIDLNNINGNVKDGIHTASMAGSWMVVVYGIAGMRDSGEVLTFSPRLTPGIDEISFRINYKNCVLSILIKKDNVVYNLLDGDEIIFNNYYDAVRLQKGESINLSLLPKLRLVLIDENITDTVGDIKRICEVSGIKCFVVPEESNNVILSAPRRFMDFIESHKVRRWDSLALLCSQESVAALKSFEIASLKLESLIDINLDELLSAHKEFSVNWRNGIRFSEK